MIGLDTNILVRYIAQDDKVQSARATALIENECSAANPGYVGLVVLAELVWVSESRYGATRREVAEIVRRVLSIRQLVVQEAEIAWKALRMFEGGKADFADCLIERTAAGAGCTRTATFDKRAGMTLLV
ncbi:MAG: type II toxin-antitoxin system VapC family toxin [Burkholderiales bacterium]|nr:type II toxin-antitoxin system VapC family toxin [Burkholderiales bacterium]